MENQTQNTHSRNNSSLLWNRWFNVLRH